MKDLKKILPLLTVILFLLSFNGCILDAFDNIPLNVPFTIPIKAVGVVSPITDNSYYSLSTSETFSKYEKKVNNFYFIGAAFRTEPDSVSDGLQGDLNLTVQDGNGDTLFTKSYTGVRPADYGAPNAPLQITLNENEKNKLDTYLNSDVPINQKSFTGSVLLQITNGGVPYYLVGYLDFVIEMDTNL
jgi:hypothetical protein